MENLNLLAGAPIEGGIRNPIIGGQLEVMASSLAGSTGLFDYILPKVVALLLVGGSIIFFFMLIWGGIQWITSGGDKAKIETARGRLTSALVGLVILFSTFALVKLIETFFGINILTLDIGVLKL